MSPQRLYSSEYSYARAWTLVRVVLRGTDGVWFELRQCAPPQLSLFLLPSFLSIFNSRQNMQWLSIKSV